MRGLLSEWWRLGGVFGVVFVILFNLAGTLQGRTPTFVYPVDEVRTYFAGQSDTYLAGGYFIQLAIVLFLLPFLASLKGLLGRVETGPRILSVLTFAGGFSPQVW